MKHQSKFSHEQEQAHAAEQQTHAQPAHREFASAEEALRFDAAQTVVPPEIAARLRQSTADLAPPRTGWLKRFFGGSKP